ncbi:hypothetical protein BdWA1_000135 [Babesia duncani]|uniref:Uncharacterized protein n=1 Tax=Babesia duncani TaxID=323732 RepID=A0AAD9PM74_9APIC|nr:hypothetical protein BdWA1_000135 [Babesia duncani]
MHSTTTLAIILAATLFSANCQPGNKDSKGDDGKHFDLSNNLRAEPGAELSTLETAIPEVVETANSVTESNSDNIEISVLDDTSPVPSSGIENLQENEKGDGSEEKSKLIQGEIDGTSNPLTSEDGAGISLEKEKHNKKKLTKIACSCITQIQEISKGSRELYDSLQLLCCDLTELHGALEASQDNVTHQLSMGKITDDKDYVKGYMTTKTADNRPSAPELSSSTHIKDETNDELPESDGMSTQHSTDQDNLQDTSPDINVLGHAFDLIDGVLKRSGSVDVTLKIGHVPNPSNVPDHVTYLKNLIEDLYYLDQHDISFSHSRYKLELLNGLTHIITNPIYNVEVVMESIMPSRNIRSSKFEECTNDQALLSRFTLYMSEVVSELKDKLEYFTVHQDSKEHAGLEQQTIESVSIMQKLYRIFYEAGNAVHNLICSLRGNPTDSESDCDYTSNSDVEEEIVVPQNMQLLHND